MILEFSFRYISSAGVIEKILQRELSASGLGGKVIKIEDYISLFVEGNEDELTKFSEKISTQIPYSIFIKDSAVKVVYEIPEGECSVGEKVKHAYCPKCLEEVQDKNSSDYYNPFKSCEVCGFAVEKSPLNLKVYEKEIVGDNKEIFTKLATLLHNGAIAKVKTLSGEFTIGKFEKKNVESLNEFSIISSDLSSLDLFAIATKEEVYALGSVEKPITNLKYKLNFRAEHDYLKKLNVDVKLADDLLLFLLLKDLRELGTGFVFATKEDLPSDISLSFDSVVSEEEPLKVSVLENQEVVIIGGERSLQPLSLSGEGERSHQMMKAVMKEYGVEKSNLAGIYLSKESRDKFVFYTEKIGVMNYVNLNFNFDSFSRLLERISTAEEVAEKLIKNYKNTYPEIFEVIENRTFERETLNVYKLLGVISYLLGFYKGDSLIEASETLLKNATNFLGKKGPSIDFKPIKVDDRYYLDIDKTIRSCMSFKLAGSDPEILSFGILESLATFASDIVDNIHTDLRIDGVFIGGDLFTNKPLLEKSASKIGKNHKLLFPKESSV